MTNTSDALLTFTRRALDSIVPADTSLCLAYSGGLDSTVLLDLLVQLRPGHVRAAHINHGLQPPADDWARSCVTVCEGYGVVCDVIGVALNPEQGNLEAEARAARYQALRNHLAADEWLVTAHHQQDQAETLLLALLRGSGVHGLAAMPPLAERDGMTIVRPLLDASREELAAYAAARNLVWTDDPSNADERFDRNYLRQRVVPLLEQRWPAAGSSIARSARLAAGAMRVLDERARDDLKPYVAENSLQIAAFAGLSQERAQNALRAWCRQLHLPLPTELQSQSALSTLLDSRVDGEPLAAWPGARIRRYRDVLYAYPESADPGAVMSPARIDWPSAARGERLQLGPVRGSLQLLAAVPDDDRPGLLLSAVDQGCEIRFRSGGERLRTRSGGPTRELKKLLQEDGVLPWMRTNIPLLYVDGQLAAVGEHWLNHDHPAVVSGRGMLLEWRAHSPLHSPF
ncbi:MAG: tRNA lysidine(34) synthetase TilS [Gammaproteobacteria bacterium]|nr:tRNA lysidine(34) synthetase TilS [Gammaproteobacteria bacterium]